MQRKKIIDARTHPHDDCQGQSLAFEVRTPNALTTQTLAKSGRGQRLPII
jgi:hypothetical protein